MQTRCDQCLFVFKLAVCFTAIILCGFLTTTVDAKEQVRGPIVVRNISPNQCMFIPKGKSKSAKNIQEGVDPTFDVMMKRKMADESVFRVKIRFFIKAGATSSQLCRFVKMKISGSTGRYKHKAVSMIRALSAEDIAPFFDWKNMSQQHAFAELMRAKFSTFNHMFGLEIRSAFFER